MARTFKRRRSSKRLFERISPTSLLRGLFLCVTTIALVALILTLLSPYVEPSTSKILTLLALVAPAIYIANLIFALSWIILWRWHIAIPIIVVLLIGLGNITLFVKIPLTKEYDTKSYRGMVKVMSYNVKGIPGGREVTLAEYLESEAPDILLLQEWRADGARFSSELTPKIAKYHTVSHSDLTLFSRYPILRSEVIIDSEDVRSGNSMWSDLLIGSDTIRVFNNHLQSTTITPDDNNYLTTTEVVRDTNRHHTLRNIFSRYVQSCINRASQAEIIAHHVAQSPYPSIVAGDFNDTPISYSYSTIAYDLKDAFQECGRNYSHTFVGFFNMLRIDYILTSEDLTPSSYRVDEEVTFSDHLPVMSHIKIR